MTGKSRYVRCPRCLNVLPEPTQVPVYKCGGCNATLQAKKRNNSIVNTTSQRRDDDSSGKQKVDQLFGEASSSSNQQTPPNFTDASDQNTDHDEIHRSNLYQNAASKAINGAPSSGKQKLKQLSDYHEASSSSNQQSLVNSMDEPHRHIHSDPHSSTELSGHEDPESSPEATDLNGLHQEQEQNQDQDHYQDADKKKEDTTVDATLVSDDNETSCSLNQQLRVSSKHCGDPESSPESAIRNRIDEDNNDDNDQVFLSCRHEIEFEESGSEFEEDFANTRIVRDSDCGSNTSFKSLIAEKLLDTRPKKPVCVDEDDVVSTNGSADLHHTGRFDRISSVETTETAHFGGKGYYKYEGSVSSFDGNDNHVPRKSLIDSGNGYRFHRRSQIHPSNGRLGKAEHRSTDVRSFYGLNEFHLNTKHRPLMIPENPKSERIELLKMVRELQHQLKRTNISHSHNHVLNNPGRYGRRMAFSGEATAGNRRLESLDGSSSHHCRPQDRHFSAQLPGPHVCCNGSHYGPSTFYSPRISGPSSPAPNWPNPLHNHSESELSSHDDFIYQNNDVTKPFRSPKKRYVRPIVGGSPLIICYRCSKLLELPQSVFVLNKRYHSLKCGACLKVLNFTLSNGTNVSRYYPDEMIAAPPSSEVEGYGDESWAGPVSCSEYSFQKSYSTETDRNGSQEWSEARRKPTMSRDLSGSTRPSFSKVSGQIASGIKGGPKRNGSPLHRLMGYASPSKVIRG